MPSRRFFLTVEHKLVNDFRKTKFLKRPNSRLKPGLIFSALLCLLQPEREGGREREREREGEGGRQREREFPDGHGLCSERKVKTTNKRLPCKHVSWTRLAEFFVSMQLTHFAMYYHCNEHVHTRVVFNCALSCTREREWKSAAPRAKGKRG